MHALSPEEIDPAIRGDLKLVDCESNAFVEVTASAALLKQYKRNLAGFCESLREFCASRGMQYIRTPTSTPLEQLTLDILRRGGMLK